MADISIDIDETTIISVGFVKKLPTFDDCLNIALKAVEWGKCKHIEFLKKGYINSTIIKKLKMCLVRQISVSVNGKDIIEWSDLNEFMNEVDKKKEEMERAKRSTSLTYLISQYAPELIPYITSGYGEEYLDMYMSAYGKGYGIDHMATPMKTDKLSHGTYMNGTQKVEWSTDRAKTKDYYRETLEDKVNMYINLHWYLTHGIEPEKNPHGITCHEDPEWIKNYIPYLSLEEAIRRYTEEILHEEIEIPFVVPVSACSKSTQLWFD